MLNKEKPIIINIDGNDGCGKTTIIQYLVDELTRRKFRPKVYKFPSYGFKYAGPAEYIIATGIDNTDPILYYQAFSIDRQFAFRDNIYNDYINNKADVFIFDRSWISGVIYALAVLYHKNPEAYVYNSFTDKRILNAFKKIEFYLSEFKDLLLIDESSPQSKSKDFFNTCEVNKVNEGNFLNIILAHKSLEKNMEMLKLSNKKMDSLEKNIGLFRKVYEISNDMDFINEINGVGHNRTTYRVELEYDNAPDIFLTPECIVTAITNIAFGETNLMPVN